MARFEFKLPDIGEGVAEGEIVAWHVKGGDVVKEDQPMVEVMTDKATVTIGAPKKGTILETLATVGQIMPVGALLVVIETDGSASAPTPAARAAAPGKPAAKPTAKSAEGPAATAVGDIKDTLPGATFFGSKDAAARPANGSAAGKPPGSAYYSERPRATPATRKLARDLEVDLRRIPPTGDGNRITAEDVRSFVGAAATKAHSPVGGAGGGHSSVPGVSGRAPIALHVPVGTAPREGELEVRKPFVGVRRKIAERMQTAKNTAAHFTFVEECDVGRLKELRHRLRPSAEAAGVKLTFLPFIVRAVVAALKKHPVLNSALDESTNELVTRKYFHIGIAASTDQGLMVPVVKDADRKSILDLAREIDRLGSAARSGTIASADLAGSTFTITSLGTQGGLFATPILNHPEVGILGVHQIKKKPVVRNDQIVIGEVMLLSLSFDHRIVDGHVGAAFAYDIIGLLESPEALFLDMV